MCFHTHKTVGFNFDIKVDIIESITLFSCRLVIPTKTKLAVGISAFLNLITKIGQKETNNRLSCIFEYRRYCRILF